MDAQNLQNETGAAVAPLSAADAIDLAQEKGEVSIVDYKMITFSLAGKDYGIDIMEVKEIAKAGRFTYVPNTMPFVLGVYNLRGDIIPIIDFRIFFNIPVPERKNDELENLLIVTVGEQTFGIVVDEIDTVVGIQKSTIQPPHPLFGDINIKYIYGVAESNKHLYILLDIDKIFTSRITKEDAAKAMKQQTYVPPVEERVVQEASESSVVSESVKEEKPVDNSDKDYSFVVTGLADLGKFYVTDVNERWVKERFAAWTKERGAKGAQLQNAADAEAFLTPFWSQNTGTWWSSAYADAVYKLLPDNTAKQIIVWNPGCGKGYESYSLACILKKRYPDARIRVYAHEIDLLNVSNAPLLSIPANVANDWYAPYVTKKANGEYTFTQDIKDAVMFEYHDCTNTNAIPVVDIVFARDTISFLPQAAQAAVINDFEEKVKGNGIVILGENESLGNRTNWGEKLVGNLVVYNKQ
ncbi:MAG: chemotaxis protein CheW [Treponema sp.]|nr:chemotaxis protein CheW [Treponema sp.]